MLYKELKGWVNPADLEGLVYFAQLLDELTFKYSLDTYKPSAMNTSVLCDECLNVIDSIKGDGIIEKPNLKHVVEELIHNLRSDVVAKELIEVDIDVCIKKLLNITGDFGQVETVLNLINNYLDESSYKDKCETLLSESIKNPRDKKLIRQLTRNYVTTLINYGFDIGYIYWAVKKCFFNGNKINSCDVVDKFLKFFKDDKFNYDVLILVDDAFNVIQKSSGNLGFKFIRTEKNDYEKYIKKCAYNLNSEYTSYVLYEDIEAFDVFSARAQVESMMSMSCSLINLFHHKETPAWSNQALMIEKERSKGMLVNRAINPMLKCIDMHPNKASKELANFVDHFFLESNAFSRFKRSAELHAKALSSSNKENQLINLWVALETLIPQPTTSKAKINNIIDSLSPFITLSYLPRLIDRLVADLFNWDKKLFLKSLKKVSGKNTSIKLVKLLVDDEYKKEKNQLYVDLNDFYLLRNRCDYFEKNLSSGKVTKRILLNHCERVNWQIRRIYRARNSVIHAGKTPNYIGILIENLHDYLDIVMSIFSAIGIKHDIPWTLEESFKSVEIRCEKYIDALDTAIDANKVDDDLIEQLLTT